MPLNKLQVAIEQNASVEFDGTICFVSNELIEFKIEKERESEKEKEEKNFIFLFKKKKKTKKEDIFEVRFFSRS